MKTKRSTALLLTLSFLSIAGLSSADDVESTERTSFNIPPQDLEAALIRFSEQTDIQLVMASADVNGKEVEGISGEYTSATALDTLLADTNLEYSFINDRTVSVSAVAAEARGASDSKNLNSPTPVLMAQNQTSAQQSQSNRSAISINDEQGQQASLDEIVVTGTLIRGIAPESSPTRLFSREDIQASGAGTVQEFMRTVTENFAGGVSEFTTGGLPNDRDAERNVGLGSSVNLRGLGSGSTLVLLNGRRLAPASSIGNITDISMIPASAVERIEILTDGASSIYGSDAVAGVVNFILRDDFEGVETSLRYGLATQNRSAEEFGVNATGGLNWDSGNAILTLDYLNQEDLGVEDRSFSQSALPPGDLRPSQERHSVIGTVTQDLSATLQVFTDITYSRREARRDSRVVLVGDVRVRTSDSRNLSVAAGGVWEIADSWFLDFSGSYGESSQKTSFTPSSGFRENETDSEVWSSDIKLSGPILQLPGGDLKLAFGAQLRKENFSAFDVTDNELDREGERDVYAAFGEVFIPIIGPDNSVPGIERLELNVSGRLDDYSDFGSTTNPKFGILWSPAEGLRLRGTYSESFNPPPIGLARDVFGLAWNSSFIFPLLGIEPADPSLADTVGLSIAGTAQNLGPETSRAFTVGMDLDHAWDKHRMAFSTTWFDIEFDDRLGFTPIPGGGTSFDVPNIAFNDPNAFPPGTVIFAPTLDQITTILDDVDNLSANSPPIAGDPFDATFIEFTQITRNLTRSIVSGLDLSVSYDYESDFGRLSIGIDATYLLDYEQQAASTAPVVSLLNTQFNPVDLKLRGRAGYLRNGFAANLFVNYVDAYKVGDTVDTGRISSWTTFDLSLSYDTQGTGAGLLLDDFVFRLSAINVFDQEPPSAPPNSGFQLVGYDPTNASPLGRFIAFDVTKRF